MIAEEWDREIADGFEWQQRWEAVFSSSFERADNEALTEAAAPEMVGSTAVVVVLSGCQIIISNCGDSRAVLCRGTETIPLTVDQKVLYVCLNLCLQPHYDVIHIFFISLLFLFKYYCLLLLDTSNFYRTDLCLQHCPYYKSPVRHYLCYQ